MLKTMLSHPDPNQVTKFDSGPSPPLPRGPPPQGPSLQPLSKYPCALERKWRSRILSSGFSMESGRCFHIWATLRRPAPTFAIQFAEPGATKQVWDTAADGDGVPRNRFVEPLRPGSKAVVLLRIRCEVRLSRCLDKWWPSLSRWRRGCMRMTLGVSLLAGRVAAALHRAPLRVFRRAAGRLSRGSPRWPSASDLGTAFLLDSTTRWHLQSTLLWRLPCRGDPPRSRASVPHATESGRRSAARQPCAPNTQYFLRKHGAVVLFALMRPLRVVGAAGSVGPSTAVS